MSVYRLKSTELNAGEFKANDFAANQFTARHSRWSMSAALVLTGCLLGGSMVMGIYKYTYGSPFGGNAEAPEATVLGPPTSRNQPPAPKVPAQVENPIILAKALKPLVDSQKEDRVIYQGGVCKWLAWKGTVDTSVIKCSSAPPFNTQTANLTPVEMRTNP